MLNIYLDVSTKLPSHRTLPCCKTAPDPTLCRPPNITAGTFFWLALPPCRHTAIPSPIHPWFPVVYKYSLTWTVDTCKAIATPQTFPVELRGNNLEKLRLTSPRLHLYTNSGGIRRKHDEATGCRQVEDRCVDQYLYNYHSSL